MTVKTEHGTYECRDLTFKARRDLHRLEVLTVNIDGEVDVNKYYDVIEWVMQYALDDPEEKLGHLDDMAIDSVISEIYRKYKIPAKKKS